MAKKKGPADIIYSVRKKGGNTVKKPGISGIREKGAGALRYVLEREETRKARRGESSGPLHL